MKQWRDGSSGSKHGGDVVLIGSPEVGEEKSSMSTQSVASSGSRAVVVISCKVRENMAGCVIVENADISFFLPLVGSSLCSFGLLVAHCFGAELVSRHHPKP